MAVQRAQGGRFYKSKRIFAPRGKDSTLTGNGIRDENAIRNTNWGREENNAAKSKFMGTGERHRVNQG